MSKEYICSHCQNPEDERMFYRSIGFLGDDGKIIASYDNICFDCRNDRGEELGRDRLDRKYWERYYGIRK